VIATGSLKAPLNARLNGTGHGGSLEPTRNIGDPLTFRSHIIANPAT